MRRLASLLALLPICIGAGALRADQIPEGAVPPAVEAPPSFGQMRESATWTATLERIAQSVVAIEVDATRAFDTEWNSSSQATGFVVDAERGLILTNRHVVTAGPVTAQATFLNREEVPIHPVYRDPVHDFGLYRYDPTKLRFIEPKSLPLYPQGAQIGREIRVVGNNAGEQLSILAGTLAKLDREAPNYGLGKYNDFNTFYLQAASGTSGGSSGSPVVDIEGRVVALNAGGASGAASSFYLPLGRVQRALELIRAGKNVPRGTLQTVFKYTPYDEVRRLGLNDATEAAVRRTFPDHTGMLVVNEVLPGSASQDVLQPGDVLVRVGGRFVTQFEPLAQVLDEAVGRSVELELERGGKPVSVKVPVTDLHAITPESYLEFGDAVVHTLSYQQARHFNVPVRGAYVANPGYTLAAAGVPRGAVINEVNGRVVESVTAFEREIGALADGERATVRFSTVDDPNGSQLRAIRMDRRWFPARKCRRDDSLGLWPCEDLPPPGPAKAEEGGTAQLPRYRDARTARVAASLVHVSFDMPYSVAGITERNYHGTGLIVDARRGLVVVDRNTVPVSLGDVRITFAGTLEVPGRVVFVHPLHNLTIVAYNPTLIGDTPVRAATLATRELALGETVWVIGTGADGELKARATQVAAIDPIDLPLSRTMQFRESNLEVVQLVNPPGDYDGVLADRTGRILGLWSSFAFENGRELTQQNRGVPIDVVAEMLEHARTGLPIHSLEAELSPQPLAYARRLGLDEPWLTRLAAASATERQVLAVTRLVGGSPAVKLLRQGDLLLSVDGKLVTRFREVERAVIDRPRVSVTIWRDGAEQTLQLDTAPLDGADLDRLLQWAGATLHAPHRAMIAQRGTPPEGVYVGYYAYGSPATRYGLFPGRRIVEVDGQPTPDLDAFIRVVTGRADRASLRLRTITWNNAPEVITLKLDKHYWPTYELRRASSSWERRALE